MNETETMRTVLLGAAGDVGKLQAEVAELEEDRQVVLARLVAVEARLTRTEALVWELMLGLKNVDDEVDEKAEKAEITRLDTYLRSLDEAVCAHHNAAGHTPDSPADQEEEAQFRREEAARAARA
jgi:Tfp pilus assembly protein PilN